MNNTIDRGTCWNNQAIDTEYPLAAQEYWAGDMADLEMIDSHLDDKVF